MSCVYVFADESGNFDFRVAQGASKYFTLTTVAVQDCTIGSDLLDLRRELASNGTRTNDMFHAFADDWPTRKRVLDIIANHDIRIDATIVEKRKAQPHLRTTEERFYQYAWFLHFKYVAPRIVQPHQELCVVGATVGAKKKAKAFSSAVGDVVAQVSPTTRHRTAGLAAVSDPCLQIADYCSWAIHRKWESGKDDAYGLIAHRVRSEKDIFRVGTTYHY